VDGLGIFKSAHKFITNVLVLSTILQAHAKNNQ
jgi:hypothetical protein